MLILIVQTEKSIENKCRLQRRAREGSIMILMTAQAAETGDVQTPAIVYEAQRSTRARR